MAKKDRMHKSTLASQSQRFKKNIYKLINPRLLEYLGCNMQLAGHVNIVLIMLIVMDIRITVADVSVIPQLACGGWSATDEHHRFAGSDGSFGIR